MEWIAEKLDDYKSIAKDLLNTYSGHKIFLLHGEMGAGKTTFTKRLIETLGVEEAGSSPTFGIVNEYEHPKGLAYHLDCYRFNSEEEAEGIGIYDYLDSGHYCFIEWPERIENLLPEHFVIVKINVQEGVRKISTQEY